MEGICKLLVQYEPEMVFIEQQQAMPRQGVASTFKTGFGYGVYIGILHALGYSYTVVIPRKWKSDWAVPSDKDLARQRATRSHANGREQLVSQMRRRCCRGLVDCLLGLVLRPGSQRIEDRVLVQVLHQSLDPWLALAQMTPYRSNSPQASRSD